MNSREISQVFWGIKRVIDEVQMDKREKGLLNLVFYVLAEICSRESKREQCEMFRLCSHCQMEIDLRKGGSYYMENNFYRHTICPQLKQKFKGEP